MDVSFPQVTKCPVLPERWWRDPELLVAEVERHGGRADAGRAHTAKTGSTPNKLAKAWADFGLPPLPDGRPAIRTDGARAAREQYKPGLKIKGDAATLVTEPTPYDLGDIDALLRDRGLDPDDWDVVDAVVNEWDANAGLVDGDPVVLKLRQLKVRLKRRLDLDWLFPASEVEKRWAPPKLKARKGKPRKPTLAVVCSDQQAPYHDERLHQAFCRWLLDVQPQLGALAGDLLDNPTISRYGDRPRWNAGPQECIDAGFRILSDIRDANPATRWMKIRGNHDIRLEAELLGRAERMFGLKPADIPGTEQVAGYSLRNLLHLDALGIELVGVEGDKWEVAEMTLAPGVTVTHKLPTKEKANRVQRTILAGDAHRQTLRRVTFWDGDDARIETLVEVGCMCEIQDGLGYVRHPDWQPGFATVLIFPDGATHVEFAKWTGTRLIWRGQSW